MAKNRIHSPISRTSHNKKKFLECYRDLCIIGKAAEATGICRRTVELWREKDKDFREAFHDAREDVIETLEAEARRRAVDGFDEPVYYKGEICGAVRKYSDTLLIFLLKGAAPEKYRENYKVEHGGSEKLTQLLSELAVNRMK